MVITSEAFRASADMEQDAVWKEIEGLARALLRSSGKGGRGRPVLELEAMIPSPSAEDACYHARVKRMNRSDSTPAAILVAVERRRTPSPAETNLREWYKLTPREVSVALLLAARRSNDEIAAELCLSPYTVRRHTERVLLKMGLQRRTEVATALRSRTDRRLRSATRSAGRKPRNPTAEKPALELVS